MLPRQHEQVEPRVGGQFSSGVDDGGWDSVYRCKYVQVYVKAGTNGDVAFELLLGEVSRFCLDFACHEALVVDTEDVHLCG